MIFPEWSRYVVFIGASIALLLIPGPAVLYIVARSVDQGRKAGIVSVLGIQTGGMFHVIGAALGVSAILAASALAFSVLKYAGAAYLVFLGLRKLFFEKDGDPEAPTIEAQPLRAIYRQGIIVQILNPKAALFFFAYLPQFTNPARGSLAIQMLVLGMTFMMLAVISDSTYAMLAGTVGKWLKGNRRFLRRQRLFSGTVYVGLGLLTALSGAKSGS